jgi:D-aminoacyl-tRNA deacylase
MIAVVQRVLAAHVSVANEIVGQIGPGLVVLAAVEASDTDADVTWTANKLAGLRIFRNGDKHFDLDVKQSGGSILLVSNFTVAAETKRGRRPSLDNAAPPDKARALFDQLVAAVQAQGIPTATGQFAADMQVTLTNDGPSTFLVKSREDSIP